MFGINSTICAFQAIFRIVFIRENLGFLQYKISITLQCRKELTISGALCAFAVTICSGFHYNPGNIDKKIARRFLQ
jgi:hypothetical protein